MDLRPGCLGILVALLLGLGVVFFAASSGTSVEVTADPMVEASLTP